jgi:hypothetical protein
MSPNNDKENITSLEANSCSAGEAVSLLLENPKFQFSSQEVTTSPYPETQFNTVNTLTTYCWFYLCLACLVVYCLNVIRL